MEHHGAHPELRVSRARLRLPRPQASRVLPQNAAWHGRPRSIVFGVPSLPVYGICCLRDITLASFITDNTSVDDAVTAGSGRRRQLPSPPAAVRTVRQRHRLRENRETKASAERERRGKGIG